ncbi:ZP domain-containing protein-like [Diadema setosum]|uniref:ZP domain-containing protein-like n=1 Tax=Diadema setosum TaxID=31175 RepID=UPI003B3B3A90
MYILSSDTQVICTSFSMTVFIDKSLLSDDSANNVHFEDETCGSFDYDPEYVALNTSYDMCRTKMMVTDDKIIYSNVVTYYSAQAINGTDITRDKNLQVSVQCELDRRQLLEENYLTVTGVISYREAGFGNFSLSLARYRDDSFDSPIVDDQSEVELGDPLYFAVELLSVRGLAVFIENCWATPTPYPNSHKRYAFLTDGCEEDPTLEIIDHSDPSFQPFIIEAFTFIKENPEVFIHCQVLVCDNEDPTSRCVQGCQSRNRRSVRQPRGTKSAPHLISNGPLFLRRDGTSHMEDNPQGAQFNYLIIGAVVGSSVAVGFMMVVLIAVFVIVKSVRGRARGDYERLRMDAKDSE